MHILANNSRNDIQPEEYPNHIRLLMSSYYNEIRSNNENTFRSYFLPVLNRTKVIRYRKVGSFKFSESLKKIIKLESFPILLEVIQVVEEIFAHQPNNFHTPPNNITA